MTQDKAHPTKLLTEHSGCGAGIQVDQLTVRLNPGDKVVLVMGPYSAALDANRAPVASTPPPESAGQGLSDVKIAALKSQFGITSNGRGIREFAQVKDFALAILEANPTPPESAGKRLSDANPLSYLIAQDDAICKALALLKVGSTNDADHQMWKAQQKTWDNLMNKVRAILAANPTAQPDGGSKE